jgi:tRNA-splicing ligase RtcB (3'-phosphate/5'-hydroxy nucleic acid ligase)
VDIAQLKPAGTARWRIEPRGAMRVPAILYGDAELVRALDNKVAAQIINVASLPGIVTAAYTMPDAHWGYGFPIGGVAAFDPAGGGVVSAGGVGFDISCGVRMLRTGLSGTSIAHLLPALADRLAARIPAGLGSVGRLRLGEAAMDAMLIGGARWAVAQGYGTSADLEYIEDQGQVLNAKPAAISAAALRHPRDEMGTLGSGNHYLEVQLVSDVYDAEAASAFALAAGDAIVSIHCGSRGLGHQVGTEYLREMLLAAPGYGLTLPDRELACAPIASELGQRYLGAARAASNCALANRQILTDLTRECFADLLPEARLELVYDVSHNHCREELHSIDGHERRLFVHRKGATRARGPGDASLPARYRAIGQPVLVGGSMGTASYVLAGTSTGEELAFGSACHGAGRAMSRHEAKRRWRGQALVTELAARGTLVRSPSLRGIAEEAPDAYKDVDAVVSCTAQAGLARPVVKLRPVVTIKG